MKKKICLMTLSFLVLISFCSCSNMDNIENNQTSTEQITNTDFSYRTQMDIAMQHIDDPKTVATVNNVNITQVDMDLYSIGGNNHTVDKIVEYYVITDYAEKLFFKYGYQWGVKWWYANQTPWIKKTYEKFEKKIKNGAKAWEEIEQAYYEMIAKDYNIVVY